MKGGHRMPSKSEVIEPPMPQSSASNVTVNHASRLTSLAPQVVTLAPVSQNLAAVEVLPMLRDVSFCDIPNIFIRKLQICCLIFDFSDAMKNVREKEIKRQTLAELVDFVRAGYYRMDEMMQDQLIKMMSINIFRCLPPAPQENTGSEAGDPEEDETFMDPSWPHLKLVYELLLKYVVSSETDIKIAKMYLDHSFVLKLIDLFNTEDVRELEYLKTILHRIYGRFMVHRPFIRNAINNIFYRFIFETERFSGIGELLEILGSIIDGFALPIKEEHRLLLVQTLIPLHKPKCISLYHQHLSYCITQFVEKDYRLADTVIKGLLKYWPVTNCGKEVLFLGELEEVLEVTQSEEFRRCVIPLFRKIGRCVNSSHSQVAEQSLFLWNNEHIIGLIAEHRHAVLPIIFDVLEKNIHGHWSQVIVGLTSNVRKIFRAMDTELFEKCRRHHDEKEARAGAVEDQCQLNWKRLEEVAAESLFP